MNKSELVSAAAEKVGLAKKDVDKALGGIIDAVKEALIKGESVQLIGFGSFEVAARAAKKGFNPKTKQPISIPASKAVKFKVGSALKDAVNG
ncbi:MAG: HU family DNA-binding protein [Chitinivibrionia bacterium]|nr:HU family DNA-binding protein [Chitinivibrionia bacterium]